MKIRHFLMVGVASFAFAASAQAQSICFNGGPLNAACTGSSTITPDGSTSPSVITTSNIALTNNTTPSDFGAVSSSEMFSTGGGISTSFDFSITTASGGTKASYANGATNGFAFTIGQAPTANGTGTSQLGIADAHSLEVEFGTYASPSKNGHSPVVGSGISSNFIGVYANGQNTFVPGDTGYNAANQAVNLGGPCTNSTKGGSLQGAAGCLANGQLWNAQIALYHDILTVTLTDLSVSNTPVATETFNVGTLLADAGITSGPVELGFSTSDGTFGLAAVDISNWSAVPEPSSLAAFGFGLLGLGMIRRRKSAAA